MTRRINRSVSESMPGAHAREGACSDGQGFETYRAVLCRMSCRLSHLSSRDDNILAVGWFSWGLCCMIMLLALLYCIIMLHYYLAFLNPSREEN